VVSLTLLARLGRRWLRRRACQGRNPQVQMAEMPILFGNSFPKSGTHLLTQILAGFAQLGPVVDSGLPPIVTFEGDTGKQRSLTAILSDLARLLPGDISYGHLHAVDEITAFLSKEDVASYFIYRDPRDVVVSHVFYVTDINNRHVHHDFYVNSLASFEQRLEVSILGRPELASPFPDIRARFDPYLPWLKSKQVLVLRYEDLISDPAREIARILGHAVSRGFVFQGEQTAATQTLLQAIKPSESPTFRSGGSGGWKKHFTPPLKKLFKDRTGDLLIRLGYEQNQNW
jgi:hypothetical protein